MEKLIRLVCGRITVKQFSLCAVTGLTGFSLALLITSLVGYGNEDVYLSDMLLTNNHTKELEETNE